MRRILLFSAAFFSFFSFNCLADEGMWIPSLMHKFNIEDMQSKGFKLTAEDLYSINQPSIKDAIVIFGRGCTGELISSEGLIITNHHCGYGAIQRLSSIENDYLKDGFWAKSKDEELPNPGLTVRFLIRMDDVTALALNGVKPEMDEYQRAIIIDENSRAIADSLTKDNHFTARVAPLFNGNQYFVYIYEEFQDVRLVGTPPSSIGKFGGDTDNWMWPRHTGDFSLFRIYADKDNKPAKYSPDNVPYKPKRYLPISLKGVNPGDFTMVYGYPGTTQQFLTSHAVNLVANVSNPLKIFLRDARLKIMEEYMRQNDTVRIKYASKQAGVANAWKKWIGEKNGLKRLKAVEKKEAIETDFANWINGSPERVEEYGNLLLRFSELYNVIEPLEVANDIKNEAFKQVELIKFASQFNDLIDDYFLDSVTNQVEALKLIESTRSFYKDYHLPIDKNVFAMMMHVVTTILPDSLQPDLLKTMITKGEGDWTKITDDVYSNSLFADSTRLIALLKNISNDGIQEIYRDKFFVLNSQFDSIFTINVVAPLSAIKDELNVMYRIYIKGLMEMQPDKVFYPDANFTLRVAYGNVAGYSPNDGIDYHHLTTLEGIVEKSKMDVYDYEVPQKLIDLHKAKDYGRWEQDGTVPVAFLATNHTSGGNSGSPIINAEGHLVGVNFDRVWEGTMSDIMFDPKVCRNISVDIRYVLFIVDKFANAGYLLNEMKLIE